MKLLLKIITGAMFVLLQIIIGILLFVMFVLIFPPLGIPAMLALFNAKGAIIYMITYMAVVAVIHLFKG